MSFDNVCSKSRTPKLAAHNSQKLELQSSQSTHKLSHHLKHNKRRAVAAQTAQSLCNFDTHCLGTIDIPGQVGYLSRSQ